MGQSSRKSDNALITAPTNHMAGDTSHRPQVGVSMGTPMHKRLVNDADEVQMSRMVELGSSSGLSNPHILWRFTSDFR